MQPKPLTGYLLLASLAACPSADVVNGDQDAGTICDQLMSKVCGARGSCQDSIWCEAARLVAQDDLKQSRCAEMLQDDSRFAACLPEDDPSQYWMSEGNYCRGLLDQVCGETLDAGDSSCAATPACQNARVLTLIVTSEDAGLSAGETRRQERCQLALQERDLYPVCKP